MSIGTKFQEAPSAPLALPTEALLLPHREEPLFYVKGLYELVTERKVGSWQRIHKPRPDGVIIELAFGESSFLAGETNSKLQNLVSLLEGSPLRNVSATVIVKQGDRPNGHELCLSCPVALRAKISIDKIPRQDVIDEIFRANKRDYQTEVTELSLSDITHIGLFQARQESIAPKWESQLSLLKDLLSKTMNQGS